MAAGADCAFTLRQSTRMMTLDEFIEFLEPQPAIYDPTGKELTPERGPAICQSQEDWNKMKTVLEAACIQLGESCGYELREAIAATSRTIDSLLLISTLKARAQRNPQH